VRGGIKNGGYFLLRKNDDNNVVLELVVISEARAVNGSEEKAFSSFSRDTDNILSHIACELSYTETPTRWKK